MLQLGQMQVESTLFFESVEQIYLRVFQAIKPRSPLPAICVRFRKYANANSRIHFEDGCIKVDITDLLQDAPAPIQEALASILLRKLFRQKPDASSLARYRHYLNRADMRNALRRLKQDRGRKVMLDSAGLAYDLRSIFEDINLEYFDGLMAQPRLGWSLRPSRTILGHYDPCHNSIVLSRLLDNVAVPAVVVRYVMFHEMLHLRFPTEHRGARRCVHTREFKAAEICFQGYEEAQGWLKRLPDILRRSAA